MTPDIDKIKETLLRNYIQRFLIKENDKTKKNISILRKLISTILNESGQYYDSTGLNTLKALLLQLLSKKPSEGGEIGNSYKSLTTSPNQRKSYRKHLMLWIKELLENYFSEREMETKIENSINNNDNFSIIDEEEDQFDDSLDEGKWKIVFNDEMDENFDEGGDSTPNFSFSNLDSETKDLDSFTILSNEDPTGLETAKRVFSKIQKPIIDALSKLSDELDQKVFSLFLLKNLDVRFNEWEEQITQKKK